MQLTDFKVLTFDCYGTLIDWETGIIENLRPLTSRVDPPLSRDDILQAHARHEAAQQIATPTLRYNKLLAVVCKRLAEEWRTPIEWDDCLVYGSSVKDWPAFPDSAEALIPAIPPLIEPSAEAGALIPESGSAMLNMEFTFC
jgi:FMN phosphatase YigB (HAD superfamily)